MTTTETIILAGIASMPAILLGLALVINEDMIRRNRILILLFIIATSLTVGQLLSSTRDHVVVPEPLVPVDTLILTRRAIDTIPDTVFIYKIRNNERKRSDQVDGHLHREDEGHMLSQGR